MKPNRLQFWAADDYYRACQWFYSKCRRMQINAPLRAGDLPPSQIIRDARDKKIVEQSLRDMSTAAVISRYLKWFLRCSPLCHLDQSMSASQRNRYHLKLNRLCLPISRSTQFSAISGFKWTFNPLECSCVFVYKCTECINIKHSRFD